MPLTDKMLGNQVTAAIKYFSKNKEYSDVGCLLLIMLESLEKENWTQGLTFPAVLRAIIVL